MALLFIIKRYFYSCNGVTFSGNFNEHISFIYFNWKASPFKVRKEIKDFTQVQVQDFTQSELRIEQKRVINIESYLILNNLLNCDLIIYLNRKYDCMRKMYISLNKRVIIFNRISIFRMTQKRKE